MHLFVNFAGNGCTAMYNGKKQIYYDKAGMD